MAHPTPVLTERLRTGLRDGLGLGGRLYNASGGTLVGVACAPHTYANIHGNTPDDCYFD